MSIDRRAVATRKRIGEAMLRLGGIRAIEAIRVEDLAREAGIARSTFYAHFRGLDDYLGRSFADMLEGLASRGSNERVLPVEAIVRHVAAAGEGAYRLARHRHFPGMLHQGERSLRRLAEVRLAGHAPHLDSGERAAMATMLAAGFLSLLRDWMENPRGRDPLDIAKRFETLELRLVGAAALR